MKDWEFHVLKEWSGKTIQEVLSVALSISKGEAKKLLDQKCVFVNNKRTWMAKHVINPGDIISVAQTAKKTAHRKQGVTSLEHAVLYKDENYFIFNKPSGLTSNGSGSFETFVQKSLRDRNIKAIHRLDRDTTGCLIFSRSEKAWDALYQIFKGKEITKVYHVLCVGKFVGKERRITAPIDGKDAVSLVKLVKLLGDLSLLEVVIETGRTHQIRKHLLSIGLPVLGDKEYTSKRSEAARYRGIERQMLHASKISFEDPIGGKRIEVQAAYPDDFADIVKRGI